MGAVLKDLRPEPNDPTKFVWMIEQAETLANADDALMQLERIRKKELVTRFECRTSS